MEVVPDRVAAEISKRTSMLVLSMGGGAGCDCQYLFAEDILGMHDGHYPRHSKRYRNFLAEIRTLASGARSGLLRIPSRRRDFRLPGCRTHRSDR